MSENDAQENKDDMKASEFELLKVRNMLKIVSNAMKSQSMRIYVVELFRTM